MDRENTWRSEDGAGSGRGQPLTVGKLLLNILGGQFVAVPQLCQSAASGLQIRGKWGWGVGGVDSCDGGEVAG